jgi:hypothetical protein
MGQLVKSPVHDLLKEEDEADQYERLAQLDRTLI